MIDKTTATSLDQTLADLIEELRKQRRRNRWRDIATGVVAVLFVAVAWGAVANRHTVNDVKANRRDDVVRACQVVNRANQITREAFAKQADIFAKVIPPTPSGLDALAQLRGAVPEDHDQDCNGNGTRDAGDYPG